MEKLTATEKPFYSSGNDHRVIVYQKTKLVAICFGETEEEALKTSQIVSAVSEMEDALRSFIAGMGGEEQFPGHNQAYLEQVVLPRAKEALIKAGIIKS